MAADNEGNPIQTPIETPAAPLPDQGQPQAAPPEAPSTPTDSVLSGLFAGLARATGEPPEPVEAPIEESSDTFGETIARAQDQRAAAPPEEPPADKAGQEPPAAPASAPADTKPPEAAKPPAAEPPAEPVEVERRPPLDKLIDMAVNRAVEASKSATPNQTAAEPPKAPADPFEASLTDHQREELEFARYAAAKNPELKAHPEKLLSFWKRTASYMEQALKSDPSRTFDDSDEDFERFRQQNEPQMAPTVRRTIERQRLRDEIAAEVVQTQRQALEELQQNQRRLEAMPRIERGTDEFSKGMQALLAGDAASPVAPLVQRAKEAGWDKVVEEDPLIGPMVRRVHEDATVIAAEYLALVANVKPFDPTDDNHRYISQFVQDLNEGFAANAGKDKVRNGKAFLPVGEFNAAYRRDPKGTAQKHWTFSERETLTQFAHAAKSNVEKRVKEQLELLEKAGYRRQSIQSAATPPAAALPKVETSSAPQPPKINSPKATPSASPGAAQTTPTAPDPMTSKFFSALGLAPN